MGGAHLGFLCRGLVVSAEDDVCCSAACASFLPWRFLRIRIGLPRTANAAMTPPASTIGATISACRGDTFWLSVLTDQITSIEKQYLAQFAFFVLMTANCLAARVHEASCRKRCIVLYSVTRRNRTIPTQESVPASGSRLKTLLWHLMKMPPLLAVAEEIVERKLSSAVENNLTAQDLARCKILPSSIGTIYIWHLWNQIFRKTSLISYRNFRNGLSMRHKSHLEFQKISWYTAGFGRLQNQRLETPDKIDSNNTRHNTSLENGPRNHT